MAEKKESPAFTSTTTAVAGGERGCLLDGTPPPCMVVIVGASGDLTARKIVPALYNLYIHDGLPEHFFALGCARTDLTTEAFREKMKEALKRADLFDPNRYEAFAKRLHYQSIEYDDGASFDKLAERLIRIGQRIRHRRQ